MPQTPIPGQGSGLASPRLSGRQAAVSLRRSTSSTASGGVAQERRPMPGLEWVARDTTYNAMGHVRTVLE